ncbi:hypothetical protein ES703_01611 [subsurface metagenome]
MSEDSFETLWNFTIEEIADVYLPGTFDFLEKHRPKLYDDISLIEDTINQDWEKKRMVAFKIDTKNWQKLMKQGIEQFERERMQVPKQEKPASQISKSKPKSSESEAPRRKTFFEVFQEMKAKENF